MDAIITIDGRDVRFRQTAATPIYYRRYESADYFKDLASVQSTGYEFDVVYRLLHCYAKQADPANVPSDMASWLDQFESFDAVAVITKLAEIFAPEVRTLKKTTAPTEEGSPSPSSATS